MNNTITDHIDNITNIPDEYRTPLPPCPKSVKIELTGRCNFACAYCARSFRLRDQKDMDQGLFERIVREMREAGVEEIGMFYLGESFLVSWLAEAIEFAKHECGYPYVFLTTNGSLATPERMKGCMEAGLDSLKFSFNYADEKQFEEIARVKGRLFRAVLKNITAAHAVREKGGYRTGLYASYILYDGAQGEKMKAVVDDIRPYVDEVYALPLYNQADFVAEQERELGWKPTAGNTGRIGALRDPLPCWALFTEGHVTWDGKLSACCFDHDGRFHLGDLTKQPFMEAWRSEKFQALRAAHLELNVAGTVCEYCVAYS
ncbi:MAG: radical SAM protein [Alphaproteobacteria bacterium]